MYQVFYQRITSWFLAYLAILYIALGTHGLHPALHEHADDLFPQKAQTGIELEGPDSTIFDHTEDDDHCFICKFLATQHLQTVSQGLPVTPKFITVSPAATYCDRVGRVFFFTPHIRGPPGYSIV